MTKRDLYAEVTARIIQALDDGTVPWRKPWHSRLGGTGEPANIASKKPYRGINTWLLHCSPFASPFWATYKQAKQYGAQVRKGEKGSTVIFWKLFQAKDKDTGKKKTFPMLRHYTVFNAEQIDGIEERIDAITGGTGKPEPIVFDPIADAEAIVAAYPNPPKIAHGGGRACYRPGVDAVQMPRPEDFTGNHEYYSTLFHELGHSTGHSSRLDRLPSEFTFGDHAYSREELIAEMTAAYLTNTVGIESTLENSAAYIEGWRAKLTKDPKCIIIAAQAAQKAADWIRDIKPAAVASKPKAVSV